MSTYSCLFLDPYLAVGHTRKLTAACLWNSFNMSLADWSDPQVFCFVFVLDSSTYSCVE